MRGLEAVSETKSGTSAAPTDRTKRAGNEHEPDDSLGKFLAAAREKRGLSREEAVKQTRIPEHYLKMLESNDYSMISDQLYLLPFLRKYSTFLQVDPEDTAMRFVREVQRAENNPSAARIDTPLEPRRHKGRNWSGMLIVAVLIAVVVIAYLAESRHRESAYTTPSMAPVSAAPASQYAPLKPARSDAAGGQASSADASRNGAAVPQNPTAAGAPAH